MIDLVIVGWFLLGLLGLYVAIRIDDLKKDQAGFCCMALFGPIFLLIVLGHCVQVTIESSSKESE